MRYCFANSGYSGGGEEIKRAGMIGAVEIGFGAADGVAASFGVDDTVGPGLGKLLAMMFFAVSAGCVLELGVDAVFMAGAGAASSVGVCEFDSGAAVLSSGVVADSGFSFEECFLLPAGGECFFPFDPRSGSCASSLAED